MSQDMYDSIYKTPWAQGTGRIQWKGTDVCIDIQCHCGNQGHHDGAFLYSWRCSECKAVFALDPVVRLIPLTKEQADYLGAPCDEQVDEVALHAELDNQ